MPRSTRSFLFPDVNVWIALTYRGHIHHTASKMWLDSLPDDSEVYFCRLTQLGFLRLLTTQPLWGTGLCLKLPPGRFMMIGWKMVVQSSLRNHPQSNAFAVPFPGQGDRLQKIGRTPTCLPLLRIPTCA